MRACSPITLSFIDLRICWDLRNSNFVELSIPQSHINRSHTRTHAYTYLPLSHTSIGNAHSPCFAIPDIGARRSANTSKPIFHFPSQLFILCVSAARLEWVVWGWGGSATASGTFLVRCTERKAAYDDTCILSTHTHSRTVDVSVKSVDKTFITPHHISNTHTHVVLYPFARLVNKQKCGRVGVTFSSYITCTTNHILVLADTRKGEHLILLKGLRMPHDWRFACVIPFIVMPFEFFLFSASTMAGFGKSFVRSATHTPTSEQTG